jgi:competence protein ComEA
VEPAGAPWRVIESPATEQASPAQAEEAQGLPLAAIGAVLVAVAVAVLAFLIASQPDAVIEVGGATSPETGAIVEGRAGATDPGPGGIVVIEVGGGVARPGVYRLAAGSRVGDAVDAAGGYSARVDLELADRRLNLAALLKDGDEIRVPVRGEAIVEEPAPGAAGAGGADPGAGNAAAGGLVDVNNATAAQLDTLPGVGPATAAKIIAAREEQPFTSVDELGARKVVGPATLEKIRALVTVGS